MRAIDADALFEPNESTDKVLILGRNGGKTIALAEKMMRERVNMAPTITLDDLRPKGRWVEGYPVTCSICGHSAETLYEDCNIYRAIRTPYCSYCGADMRGGGEDG